MFLWGDKDEYKMNIYGEWSKQTTKHQSIGHILHLWIWALPLASALAPSENDCVRYKANVSLVYNLYDSWKVVEIRGNLAKPRLP